MKTIHRYSRLASGVAALLLPAFGASAAFFTTDTSIGVGNTNYDGQDIVAFNCTLTVDGPHTFSDVLLVNNATLTHSFASNGFLVNPTNSALSVPSGLNLVIANNLVVESGSAINADGKGYGGGLGGGAGGSLISDFPFGPPFNYISGAGGSYGGLGGPSLGGAVTGGAYGQVMTPTNSGSGGGNGGGPSGFNAGGAGGGSIFITVGGDALVDGSITADGANGTNSSSGGGAGGGIWLTAQSLEGEGFISANGGAGEEFTGGGGGGGRMAIYAGTNDFVGAMVAHGGLGAVTGGAGTVYTISTNVGNTKFGQLVVDNGGEMGTNSSVDVAEPFDLTVSGGAILALSQANLGSLVIGSNSWVMGYAGPEVSLNLTLASNATIQAGGGIFVDGQGNPSGYSSFGSGTGGNFNGLPTGGGGSYGGYGGASAGTTTQPLGGAFGSVMQPASPGTGGAPGAGLSPYNLGGSGGGAVELLVPGVLQLSGTISANGLTGPGEGSGGGSGGGILLTSGSFTGNGTVSANGGSGQLPFGGGGGGGRIAISARTNQFIGKISAYGGAGFVAGGAGTIYTAGTNIFPVGTSVASVVVDNNQQHGTNTTLTTVTVNFDLVITNGAVLQPTVSLTTLRDLYIASSSFLTVSQSVTSLSFMVTSNAIIQPGGGIVLDGFGTRGDVISSGSGGTASTNGILTGGGGGYGGYGGASAAGATGGPTYGLITTPTTFGGSGGNGAGNSPFNYGGSGGGYIALTVSGMLQNSGIISANGTPGVGQGSGGGSGGGIQLSIGKLTGSGTISANGGAGMSGIGGGGGGGRIVITCSTNQYTGVVTAYGGLGYIPGGAGTIYYLTNTQSIGLLVLDNGGSQAGTNTPLTGLQELDLTVSNGASVTFTSSTIPEFRNLVVGSNSVISMPALSQNISSQNPLTMVIMGNATIQAGGGLIFDGQGFAGGVSGQTGNGNSYLTNGVLTGGGGGHGGNGGGSGAGVPGGPATTTSDNIMEPISIGGAGGSGTGNNLLGFGGASGGSVHLEVTGTLTVNGRISANGLAGVGEGSGGGSGGSIWLTATIINGNGSISANGGAGEPSLDGGGGGGGGRIALLPTTNLFIGTITAYGGPGFVTGGAGTIYVQPTSQKIAKLLVDNGGTIGAVTPVLNVPNASFDLIVTNGGILGTTGSIRVINNILITSNSSIVFATGSIAQNLILTVASNCTIQAGGTIIGDNLISSSGGGSGNSTIVNGVTTGGGGAYGGYGGASGKGAAGGIPYGNISEPTTFGSIGGAGNGTVPNNRGGYGGALVELMVTGTLTLNGAISANGGAGVGAASGGGSGGGIYVTAGVLTGTGTISANGGAGESSLGGGGGGGGGRIALNVTSNQFTGVLSAHGGTGATNGGAGTIYTTQRFPLLYPQLQVAQLVFDNGGLRGAVTPFGFLSGVPDLLITNGAIGVLTQALTIHNLTIASNSILTMSPVLSVGVTITGSATIQTGGAFNMDGQGYSITAGTGSGPTPGGSVSSNNVFTGGGGGNGGTGGASAFGALGGVSFGTPTETAIAGSGGGHGNGISPTYAGGAGGGQLFLTIDGGLQLNGVISANGLAGVGEGSGGGAGGGINISVEQAFTGNGTISVNGGAAESSLGGGGGGGRIVISFASSQFTGSMTAFGGAGFMNGGPGTIYTQTNNGGASAIVIDGGNETGASPFTVLNSVTGSPNLTITRGAQVNAASTGRLSVRNLTVASNSVLSLAGTNGFVPAGISVTGNATIQSGGQIIADGGGFWGNSGSGGGTYGMSTHDLLMATGGSYGGLGGGSQINGNVGSSYDSITTPSLTGSGGGCANQVSQSAGGGFVQMNVTGTLDVEGLISANGSTPGAEGCGGGSGGGIQLTALTFTGAGKISANGGAGYMPNSGGGGGGRVSVRYTTSSFTGVLSAQGGQGFVAGGAGTIYTRSNALPVGSLLVNNGGVHGTNTPLTTPEAFYLTVSGNAVAETPAISSSLGDPTLFLTSLLVQSNGVLTTPSANAGASLIISGNATVATNGAISADSQGYNGSYPGLTGPGGSEDPASGGDAGGGGYGGRGGTDAFGQGGGLTYGSKLQPTFLGSQGGVPTIAFIGFSPGGGAIHMEVGGALTVNGSLTANGGAGVFPNTGGGSGGSLWLSAGALNGAGSITANGGAGEPDSGGGGGGGRIAIYSLADNFTGSLTASGGTGFTPGQNGTIVTTNLSAPQIISQSPSGPVSNIVSSITLNTTSQFASAALTPANFAITTPSGVLPLGSYAVTTSNQYPQDVTQITLTFVPETELGAYSVQLVSSAADIYGLSLTTNYVGSYDLADPIVSGSITDTNGDPIVGAMIQPDGNLPGAITDENANYYLPLPLGYTGAITPSLGGYVFVPSQINYTNLTASVSTQNFTALPPALFVLNAVPQGTNVGLAWYGVSGVKYQVLCSSNFVTWQPCGSPIAGSNAAINFSAPVGNASQMFFRFGAVY